MKLYSKTDEYKLYHGNMLDMLEVIESNSIDSIITDPPYELNFMNNRWDNSGIAFQKETWKKCYEVLKPGGYLLAFGGSRTYHRIACAIEDAGFEIRDCILWLYGSGFPKSMNISKGIEAREKYGKSNTVVKRLIEQNCDGEIYKIKQTNNGAMGELIETTRKHYTPTSDLATKWNGWGTCLKPAYEPIIVARKPFKSSLVNNVIENGVGGLNINECRIGNGTGKDTIPNNKNSVYGKGLGFGASENTNGRFPANVILTYDEIDFDEVCGGMPFTNGGKRHNTTKRVEKGTSYYKDINFNFYRNEFNDSGSASRYFYCAKASKKDKEEGLNDLDFNTVQKDKTLRKNIHPTVKPTELMQYLIRLVTPRNAIILDVFLGSGSTGKAAMYENLERGANYKFIGIELLDEYIRIADLRIKYVYEMKKNNIQLKLNI